MTKNQTGISMIKTSFLLIFCSDLIKKRGFFEDVCISFKVNDKYKLHNNRCPLIIKKNILMKLTLVEFDFLVQFLFVFLSPLGRTNDLDDLL